VNLTRMMINMEDAKMVDSAYRGQIKATPEDFIPNVMDGYIPNPDLDPDLEFLMDMGENIALLGDAAAGKTESVINYCATRKVPLFQQSGASDLTSPDMRGTPMLKDGNVEIIYGPLPLAMILGGVYLLDEATATDQSVLSTLFSVGDRRRILYMPETGETIRATEKFRLLLIGNHAGSHVRDSLKDAIRSRFQVIHVNDRHTLNVAAANLAKEANPDGARDDVRAIASSMVEMCMEIREMTPTQGQADARDLNRARAYLNYAKGHGHKLTLGGSLTRAMRGVSDDSTAIAAAGKIVQSRFKV